ncbi:hypothetical protein ACIP79_41595 [Streptomyces sp. NPDC088747]|uniref:hypothetical protein n=1 Tax=Streptomyces sp. NPDC088747 TaxID=3365886 RepID=UPI0038023E42
MSDAAATSTELKAQYAAKVTADLEVNAKEQERIGAEVAALQAQLATLQNDQVLLANLQQTLGGESLTAAGAEPQESATAASSVPRQAPARKPRAAKPGKAAATKRVETAAKNGTKTPTAAVKQPTLVELIGSRLGQQPEPHSAAEITTALAQAHPDRDIKPKVVRVTLEGLVAKGLANRTKQGSSVFYSTSTTPTAGTPAEQKDPATA